MYNCKSVCEPLIFPELQTGTSQNEQQSTLPPLRVDYVAQRAATLPPKCRVHAWFQFVAEKNTIQGNVEREVDSYLRRKYETHIRGIEMVHKEDLDLVCAGIKLLSIACPIRVCMRSRHKPTV